MSVYLPTFLFAVGQGATIPIIALLALELGASTAMAGAIVALRGIGSLLFDVPSGMLVAAFGERRTMAVGAVLLGVVALGVAMKPPLPVYCGLVLLMGVAWSIWSLARLNYATDASPNRHRGRVMSTMGGSGRVGQLLGPILGGLLTVQLGLSGPFFLQATLAIAACLALQLAPVPESFNPRERTAITTRMVASTHRRILGTAGLAIVALQILRSAKEAIIPLWGNQMGADERLISNIFAASTAIEVLLFYPMGYVMDRKGRKWASIPCLILMSLGIATIPFTQSPASLTAAALLIGLGNGFGAGMNMTLGSDLSPALGRSQFLGMWRMIGDIGTSSGPVIVAVVTALASLGAAAGAVGIVGLGGALVLWRRVPETMANDP